MRVETTSYERHDFYSLKQFNDVAMLKLGKNFLSNAIDQAIENGKQANEGYVRSLNLTKAWLENCDPESGLIPTVLNNHRRDFWEVENSGADNY